MKTIAVVLISLTIALVAGYLVNQVRSERHMIATSTDYELQDELEVYRECMRLADRCPVSIQKIRTYHAIKREIQRRQTGGAIVCRYEKTTDE